MSGNEAETDAVPSEEKEFSRKQKKKSSGTGNPGYSYSTTFNDLPKTDAVPYSVSIGNVRGPVSVGNVYTTTITNTRGVSLQSVVVYDSTSEDSSSSSDESRYSETDPEPEIDEKILNSTLCLSIANKELVSENIANNYHKMARHLKGAHFTTVEVENIMSKSLASGKEEGIFQILERWCEKAPRQATVGNLAAALQKVGRIDLANKLSIDKQDELANELEDLRT